MSLVRRGDMEMEERRTGNAVKGHQENKSGRVGGSFEWAMKGMEEIELEIRSLRAKLAVLILRGPI